MTDKIVNWMQAINEKLASINSRLDTLDTLRNIEKILQSDVEARLATIEALAKETKARVELLEKRDK